MAQSDKLKETLVLKIESIKVYSVCDMNKRRIESAALQIDGVAAAVWDVYTKMLTINYSIFKKNAVDDVQKKVASAGNDTEKYRASDADYNALPDCCHYRKDP